MATIMSAIVEAAGLKPGDDVIGLGLMTMAKSKAMAYTAALVETATPELRHIFSQHLSDALAEHERCTKLAVERGWYKAYDGPDALLQQAVKDAESVLQ